MIPLLFALASLSNVPPMPGDPVLRLPPRREPPRMMKETRVACPRCKAAIGAPCDRTRGRHMFHMARVELSKVNHGT